jgi:hypothetical protein
VSEGDSRREDWVTLAARGRREVKRTIKRSRRELSRRARHGRRGLLRRKPPAHLIHIGKTGGTAVKTALAPVRRTGRYDIQLHDHRTTLLDIPRGEKVFFVVRDPVARYVSAFNSRLREGRPRYHVPWSAAERTAFERFPTAEDLALALANEDDGIRGDAIVALSSIGHIRDSYWRWFRNAAQLNTRRDDLLLIMWLPDLSASFSRLLEALEIRENVELPHDDVGSHRTPAYLSRSLGDEAARNIRWWYSRDYGFIDICARYDCFVGPSWRSESLPMLSAPVRTGIEQL